FSLGMLRAGGHRVVPRVAGDALALPFADTAFDAVTVQFGIRNFADTGRALRELARVTKPGGRLVICEFSRPPWAPFRAAYHLGLEKILPAVADAVSSNPQAYRYLGESIRDWPAQPQLAAAIAEAGWGQVAWRDLVGGAVALHRAVRGG
ncbi:MAG: class I SAM-dependent methyltransferase, partial [Pseudonocardia sp.]|nr:class I SAM-dependent methyltransferase [Pseudonocardia sp.]